MRRFTYLFASPLVKISQDNTIDDVEPLEYRIERSTLQELVQSDSHRNIGWSCYHANTERFIEAFRSSSILHFSGHGFPDKLNFEGVTGELEPIDKSWFAELCRSPGSKPDLLFLSACHSEGVMKVFEDAGIRFIVAVQEAKTILDEASLAFSRCFYGALLHGQSVAASFSHARSAVLATWPLEADKFLLRGNGDTRETLSEEEVVLSSSTLGKNSSSSSPSSSSSSSRYLSAAFIAREGREDVFLGRQKEVYKVYSSLVKGCPLINISGPRGIGKSQVAIHTADYAFERGLFDKVLTTELASFDENTSIHVAVDALATGFELATTTTNKMKHWALNAMIDQAVLRWEGKRLLLIIDGVVRDSKEGLLTAIQAMMLKRFRGTGTVTAGAVRGRLQIIVTSVDEIGHQLSNADITLQRVYLPPLDHVTSAKVFRQRACRDLLLNEMCLAKDENPVQAFASSDFVVALNGNPRVIVQVGHELASATAVTQAARDAYSRIGETSEELHLVAHYEIFISKIIPEIQKKVADGGTGDLMSLLDESNDDDDGNHSFSSSASSLVGSRETLDISGIIYETLRCSSASEIAMILWETCRRGLVDQRAEVRGQYHYDQISDNDAALLRSSGEATMTSSHASSSSSGICSSGYTEERLPWSSLLWPLVLDHFYQCTCTRRKGSSPRNRELTDREMMFLAHNEKAWGSTSFPRLPLPAAVTDNIVASSSSSPVAAGAGGDDSSRRSNKNNQQPTPAKNNYTFVTTDTTSSTDSSSAITATVATVASTALVGCDEFTRYMSWLHPLAVNLRLVDQWNNIDPAPICVHLIDKDEAASMLIDSRSEPGTFILCISKSAPCLVVVFVSSSAAATTVAAVKVAPPVQIFIDAWPCTSHPFRTTRQEVISTSRDTLNPDVTSKAEGRRESGTMKSQVVEKVVRFATLQDLILSEPRLRKLYPDIPKDAIFIHHHDVGVLAEANFNA